MTVWLEIPHQLLTVDMPAYQASSSFTASASLSEECCCPWSSFNCDGHVFQQGEGFRPHPEEQEVFLHSNTDSMDDESWHELGLNNFIITNIQIGCHRFNRYSNVMVEQQRGLFNRGLEPWDVEERESPVFVLEASLGYTALMGMMLFEQNELQRRRVCVGIFFCDPFADCCFPD